MPESKQLLAIVELGGYPDFSKIYKEAGFEVTVEYSMRKALSIIKRRPPNLVVAEFNFQTAFRDRISNLESLMAAVQRRSSTQVIAFYEKDLEHQFERLKERFEFWGALRFPIDETELRQLLETA